MKKLYGIIYKAQFEHRIYVGQTIRSLSERKRGHKKDIARNRENFRFYNAVNKYGFDVWDWVVLEECSSKEELDVAEIKWIKHYRESLFYECLNSKSGGAKGKPSEETRRKLSESAKNISPETRKKMSDAKKGRKHSDETKQRMSISRKGKIFSEETKKKISESNKGNHCALGCKRSKEWRERNGNLHRGKIVSPETRLKMSLRIKGKGWIIGESGKRKWVDKIA